MEELQEIRDRQATEPEGQALVVSMLPL